MNNQTRAKKHKKLLNQCQSIGNIHNIKSQFLLQNLFNMIPKKKSLLIVKYNKKIQNKININIKDYKNYCEQYTTIEIEIIPAKGKYGLFYNRKDFKNFHPYFNDNKKVTKQNYILKEDKVTKIRLVIDYPIISFKKLL